MEAKRTIRAAVASGIQFTAAQAYDLTLQSTGNVAKAEEVFREARRAELRQLDSDKGS